MRVGFVPATVGSMNDDQKTQSPSDSPTSPAPSHTLAAVSAGLAQVVSTAGPAVVRLQRGRRGGSATIWRPGVLVTGSYRLRHGDGAIDVRRGDEAWQATVVGRDPGTDLAVLTVDGLAAPDVGHADGADLTVGHLVVALGRPGASVRAALGMVGGLGGPWRTTHGGAVDRYIDIDGQLPRGFGGGPLVGHDGNLLGINVRGLVPGGTTVPTATVDRVVDAVLEHGTVRRGYLGVSVQPAAVPGALVEAAAGATRGLLISGVESDGPAARAGLLLGDLLVTIDSQPVAHFHDLIGALAGKVGAKVGARVVRAGALVEVEAEIGERPRRCG